MEFKFIRNEDSFCLISSPVKKDVEYRIVLEDFYLTLTWLELHPNVHAQWEARFKRGDLATFPIIRTAMKTQQIPKGQAIVNADNLFRGVLPFSVISGLVTTNAYAGLREFNPFYFKHFNANYIQLKQNSVGIPCIPLTPDFHNENCREEYRHFQDNTGSRLGEF